MSTQMETPCIGYNVHGNENAIDFVNPLLKSAIFGLVSSWSEYDYLDDVVNGFELEVFPSIVQAYVLYSVSKTLVFLGKKL